MGEAGGGINAEYSLYLMVLDLCDDPNILDTI